jgi:hypothetical protein
VVEFTVTAIEQKTELPRFADLEPVAALFADVQRSACDESDGTCIAAGGFWAGLGSAP